MSHLEPYKPPTIVVATSATTMPSDIICPESLAKHQERKESLVPRTVWINKTTPITEWVEPATAAYYDKVGKRTGQQSILRNVTPNQGKSL
tara:strand:- start:745 stop:1017 length:273 start_codon:yes stop_codon:yes gene_type:complete